MGQVHQNTVDHFCAQRRIEGIDLLTTDVEGHDLSVIHGAQQMLQRGGIRMIQFEFGPANLASRTTFYDFWDLLSDQYELFRILATALRRIDHYEEWKDVYLTSNDLALQRSLLVRL